MVETSQVERQILGTLITWPERYAEISELAYPFMFDENRGLASYLWDCFLAGLPVDIASVTHGATSKAICTASHILSITESPAMDSLLGYAAKLREAYLIRQDYDRYAQAAALLVGGMGYEEVRAKFKFEKDALDEMIEIKADRRGSDILEAYDRMCAGLENNGINGVTSGFSSIDAHTGGWQPGNLIILGARPGMGKTTIALDFAYAAAVAGKPVMFASLEMTSTEVYYKLAAKPAAVPPSRMMKSLVSEEELPRVWAGLESVSELPLYVYDDRSVGNTLHSIQDKARSVMRSHGLSIIVIDYIQLMRGEGSNQNERIQSISQGLKSFAKQINIPIIALSQLSRDVERRGGSKRPQLADLRDSGSLEQDADIIAFHYRPEYYGIEEDAEGGSLKGKAQLIFEKHRMGGNASFWMDYVPARDTYLDAFQPASPFPASQHETIAVPASSRPGMDEPIPF